MVPGLLIPIVALSLDTELAPPIFLDYPVVIGCPAKDEFFDQVRLRTQLARLSPTADGVDTFRVRVTLHGGEAVGQLQVFSGGQATMIRELTGSSCGEIMSAFALTVALSIDPHAAEPAPTPNLAPPLRQAHPRPAEQPAQSPPAPHKPRTTNPIDPTMGAMVWWMSALVPGWSATWQAATGARASSPDGFALRAGVQYAASGRVTLGPGAAEFNYLGGFLDACPFGWTFGRMIAVAPCGGAHLGRVRSEGLDVPTPHVAMKPWIATHAVVRGMLSPTRWLAIQADAGGVVPLIQETYVFDGPRTVAWTPPSVGGILGIGITLAIP